MQSDKQWLSHINPELFLFYRSTYLITLEAWRRGLKVTFFDVYKYIISSDTDNLLFISSRALPEPESDPNEITRNKSISKEYLKKNNIPIPESRSFSNNDDILALLNYGKLLGFPVVIKPTFGTKGKGVKVNILDENSLEKEILYLRNNLGINDILIEKYIIGEDYRLQVVGSDVVGAIKRIPANVSGNGVDTIYKLIYTKNNIRKQNPFLKKDLITIDNEVSKYVQEAGFSLEYVPKKDEFIYLRGKENAPLYLSSGGDSIDVTDLISDDLKSVAVRAAQSIPNLYVAGLDIIVERSKGTDNPVVIEINSTPQLGLHVFPSEGNARDIPSAIIDYFFPESCQSKSENRNLYYNYKSIEQSLKDGVVREVSLKRPPSGKIMVRQILIPKALQCAWLEKWVKKKALKLRLNGYLKNLKSGTVLIVVYGNEKDIDIFLNSCLKKLKESTAQNVKIFEWKKHVMAGFYNKGHIVLDQELRHARQQVKTKNKELKKVRAKYKKIKQSRAWQYTKTLKQLKKFLKHIIQFNKLI